MKDIPGYEGLYSIDENGNVFSYRRQIFLKQSMSNNYLSIHLTDAEGNRKTHTIHRLVALTYIPNPNELPQVDHIDRNKLNNSVENLRWVTHRENSLNKDWEHYHDRAGTKDLEKQLQKARQISAQVRSRPVEMRDKNNHDIIIKTYPSAFQAAIQEFGSAKKQSGISKCANGKQKSAHGYFWSFANVEASCENET